MTCSLCREKIVSLHTDKSKSKKIMAATASIRQQTALVERVKPIRSKPLSDIQIVEEFADMDKELYTPEEAYELTMKDIKAIYDNEAV